MARRTNITIDELDDGEFEVTMETYSGTTFTRKTKYVMHATDLHTILTDTYQKVKAK